MRGCRTACATDASVPATNNQLVASAMQGKRACGPAGTALSELGSQENLVKTSVSRCVMCHTVFGCVIHLYNIADKRE
jgi:hypothetical protein